MLVEVARQVFTGTQTIGTLSINGVYRMSTLEDVARGAGVPKVPGRTAIPAGTYPLIIDWSPHFKRPMPTILQVPNFLGIRIHWGATEADSEGCPIIGHVLWEVTKGRYELFSSRAAFDELFSSLARARQARETSSIRIYEMRETQAA